MEHSLISVVHWFDTEVRRIACGSPGQMGSTKHQREVTCPRCRALLAQRASATEQAAAPAAYPS